VTQSSAPRPDPWAVVEHHARAAAERAPGDAMNSAQRLALYVSAAPELIHARRLAVGELGIGRKDVEWWVAPAPASNRILAWNDRGEALLSNPSGAALRRLVVGSAGVGISFLPFARLAGPRAIIPALLVGVAAAFLVGRIAPRWVLFGDAPDPVTAAGVVEALAEEYEKEVVGHTS
jgi:hypothetical protein